MHPSLSQPTVVSPKVKATLEKVREMFEFMGMDFSEFDKHKAYQNSKDGNKIATTSMSTSD